MWPFVHSRWSPQTASANDDSETGKGEKMAGRSWGSRPCSYLLNTLFNYSCVNVAFLPWVSIRLWLIATGRLPICAEQWGARSLRQDGRDFLLPRFQHAARARGERVSCTASRCVRLNSFMAKQSNFFKPQERGKERQFCRIRKSRFISCIFQVHRTQYSV